MLVCFWRVFQFRVYTCWFTFNKIGWDIWVFSINFSVWIFRFWVSYSDSSISKVWYCYKLLTWFSSTIKNSSSFLFTNRKFSVIFMCWISVVVGLKIVSVALLIGSGWIIFYVIKIYTSYKWSRYHEGLVKVCWRICFVYNLILIWWLPRVSC